jgi:hypothetical protein
MPPIPPIPTVPKPKQTKLSFNGLQILLKKPGNPPLFVYKMPARLNKQWLLGS